MKTLILLLIFSIFFISCSKKTNTDGHEGHDHSSNSEESHEGHDHAEKKESAGEHDGHDHGEGAHSEGEEVKISKQALKNMGVEIKSIDSSSYTVFKPVPAVVKENPLSERPIFAPFGGRIKSIDSVIGEFKKSNMTLITLYRDPIGRPELKMVEAILTPASEELHGAISQLSQSLTNKSTFEQELKRLQSFQKDPNTLALVPQKDLINLKYEIEKASKTVDNTVKKLTLHGLSNKDIEDAKQGLYKADLYQIWKNVLSANNIWGEKAESLLQTLGKDKINNRWVIASIGEMVAEDLISLELIEWFKKDESAKDHFLEIASLLQSGHTITVIMSLHDSGAFADIINIKAPDHSKGWDVEGISVKIGQKVSAGEKLLTLSDQSMVYLFAYPQSSEVIDITKAIKDGYKISAKPLTPGSGPKLTNLQIDKIRGTDGGKEEVLVSATNLILNESKNGSKDFRSWSLRDGQRYILEIPTAKLEDVIVLPLEAVIKHGPDLIVFVKENEEYIRRRVVVVYQNNDVAVIGDGSELLPEENIVISGSFALQLALIAGTPEAVDPHAGHNH